MNSSIKAALLDQEISSTYETFPKRYEDIAQIDELDNVCATV
jgi:hypothetical protein